jgi:hypothetical protein
MGVIPIRGGFLLFNAVNDKIQHPGCVMDNDKISPVVAKSATSKGYYRWFVLGVILFYIR